MNTAYWRLIPAAALVFVIFLFTGHAPARSEERRLAERDYIDVHMHLIGAPGRGDARESRRPPPGGGEPQGHGGTAKNYDGSADNLVAVMDRLGIQKAIVMPPPQSPNQRGGYTYRDLLGAIRSHPGRLLLGAGGGELSPILVGTDSADVTPAIRSEFERKAREIVRDGARVFGEMAILHFSFQQGHVFHQTPPDHPLYLLLADIAARHGIPIDLHWEAVPLDQSTPKALIERSSNNPLRISATIPGLERLLAHNRGAKVVLVHVGWDNTGHQTVELLRRLLAAHPNLFCGLKFVRQRYEPFGRGNKMADENLRIRSEWVRLIADFPDRFVGGADEFITPGENSGRRGPPSFEDTWSVIGQLPADLRAKVGRENAARIYGLE